MLEITKKQMSYVSLDLGFEVSHFILIANVGNKKLLLSHANLFLYSNTRSSLKTSSKYASIISMFYRFLSTQPKFQNVCVSQYHVIADNRDIRRWQIARQIKRVQLQKSKPSSSTIFEDACILLQYFKWLNENGFISNVVVQLKTWIPNFKNHSMLNYIQKAAKVKINAKNITVLDKERRQKNSVGLITNDEIRALLKSYTDPVFAAIFNLSLETAMRPMDLCQFPYIGNGKNAHILPYSSLNETQPTLDFSVVSKGKKRRTVKINLRALEYLEHEYILPYYTQRAKLYEQKYGKKCPPSILFLTKSGDPVTPDKISDRTTYAKKKAMKIYPQFREKINFYEARHWWPTMFLITFFKEKLLTQTADVLYAAAAQAIADQMGHEEIATTFKHYIDKSRLIAMAHKGLVNEIITSPQFTTREFINKVEAVQ